MNAFRVTLVALIAVMLSGCEAIAGIFKAGVWTGVIMVVIVLAIIAFAAAKMRQ
ncbi:MAG: phosphatidate cytidylyltransferase [Acidobacteria bacterium]|nr:phosphatidate cytidylyltransferase [Acidobacteriota bacterium]